LSLSNARTSEKSSLVGLKEYERSRKKGLQSLSKNQGRVFRKLRTMGVISKKREEGGAYHRFRGMTASGTLVLYFRCTKKNKKSRTLK